MSSSDLNVGMKNRHGGVVSQTKDEQWHIETLKSPEHQTEAHRRLEYLQLMPKLALFCLLSDCLYLGYRVILAFRAPRANFSVYVLLAMEICFAGISLLAWRGPVLILASCGWTFASTVAFCFG